MARGGPVAAANWGNTAVGMPWSQVKSWRKQLVAASGVSSPGRYSFTSVVVAFGLDAEPVVARAVLQVKAWLRIWFENPQLQHDIRVAWRHAHARIVRDKAAPFDVLLEGALP